MASSSTNSAQRASLHPRQQAVAAYIPAGRRSKANKCTVTVIHQCEHCGFHAEVGISCSRGLAALGHQVRQIVETPKSKRARRRRDLARKRHEARRIYPHDLKARAAEHLKVCSCWMCGNRRRQGASEALTLQERRVSAAEREFRAEPLTPRAPADGAD